MTIQDFITALGHFSPFILVAFVLIPLLAYGVGRITPKNQGGKSPYKYIYSVLVFLSSIPGVFASVITAYALFILHSNLLQVNVAVYIAPIISMAATIIIIRQNVSLDDIPGFHRLHGLFLVIAIAFIIALIIIKTRIFLFFGSSFWTLVIIFIALFALLQYASQKLLSGQPSPPGKQGE
jgi:hypothetical protein